MNQAIDDVPESQDLVLEESIEKVKSNNFERNSFAADADFIDGDSYSPGKIESPNRFDPKKIFNYPSEVIKKTKEGPADNAM